MAVAGERVPDHVRAVLQRLRAEVEKNCDYVGPSFADEARKIHNGESDKRGIYGGCVGYFGANGEMDTCIVLRTAIVKDGKMFVQAGAGVVADSVPESELQECVNKAKALFRAAEEAVRFASTARQGNR